MEKEEKIHSPCARSRPFFPYSTINSEFEADLSKSTRINWN